MYSLPPGLHKKYKQLILEIVSAHSSLDDDLVRHGQGVEKDLKFICNKKNQNIFKQFAELEALEKIINSLIMNYVDQIGFSCDEVFLSNAWVNSGSKGAALGMHMHRNSYFSGTYYVNFDPSIHSPIAFRNSRLISYIPAPVNELAQKS